MKKKPSVQIHTYAREDHTDEHELGLDADVDDILDAPLEED